MPQQVLVFFFLFCGNFKERCSWAYEWPNEWHLTKEHHLHYLTVPLTFHNQTETSQWSTPLNLHYWAKQELPRGSHDSRFTSSSRSLFLWLDVWANEALIRNLPLTLEDIAESDVKAIAAQQKSLDSLTKVVLVNRIALDYRLAEQGCDYHLAEQGRVCAVAKPLVTLGLTLLGELGFSYIRSWNKAFGLRKWLLKWSLWLFSFF